MQDRDKFLRNNCPGVKPISEAPSRSELLKAGTLEAERLVRYSATDSEDRIYLIQNPAAWEEKIVNGFVVRIRPKPELYREAASDGEQRKGRAADL